MIRLPTLIMLTTVTAAHALSWGFGILTVLSVLAWTLGWLTDLYALNFAFGFFILGELCSIHALLLARSDSTDNARPSS